MPFVRIIIPTYNRASLVGEAIESGLAQTFQDFEIIVADDGSTDGTEEIVRNFLSMDSRIRHFKLSHGGAAKTRNLALQVNGKYEYVAFLDSDDLWSSNHLEESVGVLENHCDVGLVFSRFETLDFNQNWTIDRLNEREKRMRKPIEFASIQTQQSVYILDSTVVKKSFIRNEFCPHTSTVVVRANVVKRQKWFDPSLEVYEDLELFYHIANCKQSFAFIDFVHAKVRCYGDNLTGALRDLSSPVFLQRQKSVLKYTKTILGLCSSQEDRSPVLIETGKVAYLIGQCCVEQFDLSGARYYYMEALKHQKCWRNFKGLMLSFLPFSVFYSARKIANAISFNLLIRTF